MLAQDKRVLVTGAYGFIGSHVSKVLDQIINFHYKVKHSDFDLTKMNDVKYLFNNVDPHVVIHLAASVGGIKANIDNPGKFFYDNMAMGMNLMEQARRSRKVEKFVQISTSCSYPMHNLSPITEDQLWKGYPNPATASYGIAKLALMEMGQAYRKQYGLNVITLIPANVYGPGDNFDLDSGHVVPALITKCAEAKRTGGPLLVWGTGKASREFVYVRDCAEAIVRATELYNKPEPVNIGVGHETPIPELVKCVASQVGYTGPIEWDSSKPDGQLRRYFDVSRAKKEFCFEATTSLEEGIKKTLDWWNTNETVSSHSKLSQ